MRGVSFLRAGLVAVLLFQQASAADFNGPTSYVDLPSFRPDEVTDTAVVAKDVVGTASPPLQLLLLNPDAESKTSIVSYEVVADATPQTWRIEALTKLKQRKPVAKLFVQGESLAFQWQTGVLKGDGTQLRNCVLGIEGVTEQFVGLRTPLQQSSLLLDMSKELNRIPLVDDLPEDGLLLTVGNVEGATVSNEHSADTTGIKTPQFVGLKGAEADVPGARLRVIMWKTSLKPEVLIRPELVPIDAYAGAATGGPSTFTTAPSSQPGTTIARPTAKLNVNDGSDPTRPNVVNLPYTIRSLSTAKAAIGRDLLAAKNQIVINQNFTRAKQIELARFPDTLIGTAEEIDAAVQRINQLQMEIAALGRELMRLQQSIVPALEKQIAAFGPLETLGNSLHQKASLGLRVYYTVSGKPVDVLVAQGARAEKQ